MPNPAQRWNPVGLCGGRSVSSNYRTHCVTLSCIVCCARALKMNGKHFPLARALPVWEHRWKTLVCNFLSVPGRNVSFISHLFYYCAFLSCIWSSSGLRALTVTWPYVRPYNTRLCQAYLNRSKFHIAKGLIMSKSPSFFVSSDTFFR